MSNDDLDALLEAWDEVRHAINQAECALPRQMTAAIENLLEARAQMDARIRQVSRASIAPGDSK